MSQCEQTGAKKSRFVIAPEDHILIIDSVVLTSALILVARQNLENCNKNYVIHRASHVVSSYMVESMRGHGAGVDGSV